MKKCVVLGVSGGIAAYKSANLANMLTKLGYDVTVIMTKNALNFITPLTFETLTGNRCITDTFDRDFEFDVKHISLAKKADCIIIAPATANIIGKIASGIADDMLTTTVMAAQCPVLLSPAMNTNMYNNPIVQSNMNKLKDFGYKIIPADTGLLACRDKGVGRMPDPEILAEYVNKEIYAQKDLKGKRVLVTAGATMETIDPVRFITNHSTGKMGFAIARAAMLRGAEVTLICGNTTAEKPLFVNIINVKSAEDMFKAVKENYKDMDFIFKAAAVADYTPKLVSDEKIKKKDGNMSIELKRTDDILRFLGENKSEKQILCGFSMETENMVENSLKKLESKKLDIIAANNLKTDGAGFGTDTNVITLITKNGIDELEKMSKFDAANKIIDKAVLPF